jgi:hypothetical protein
MDLNKISDEEKNLLIEVAKAKGKTLEELLTDLGHIKPPQPEAKVEFKGQAAESPAVVLEPVAVTEPVVAEEPIPQFEKNVQPEFEPPPAPEETEQQDKPEAAEPATSLGTLRQICVQCGWDQERPTIPEPEHQDKIAFLQAVLGQKVFSKRFAIFGGHLRLTFRTLTIREIDALYQETFRAQKAGLISTAVDYYEYLNRLRLYLQLTSMSSAQTAMQIKLPEGLTPETHPEAGSYWEKHLRDAGVFKELDSTNPDTPTLLLQIQDFMLTNVLKTEHLQRTITHTCNKFNQLVVKLESCVDNPNFWNETEPRP